MRGTLVVMLQKAGLWLEKSSDDITESVMALSNKIGRFDIESRPVSFSFPQSSPGAHWRCKFDAKRQVLDVMAGDADCVLDYHLAHMEAQKKRLTPVSDGFGEAFVVEGRPVLVMGL